MDVHLYISLPKKPLINPSANDFIMARNRESSQIERVGLFIAGTCVASFALILALMAGRESYRTPASMPVNYPSVPTQSGVWLYPTPTPVPSRKDAPSAPTGYAYSAITPVDAAAAYSPSISYQDPRMARLAENSTGGSAPTPVIQPATPPAPAPVSQEAAALALAGRTNVRELYDRFFPKAEMGFAFWTPQDMMQYDGKRIKDVSYKNVRFGKESRYFLATFWRDMNHVTRKLACYLQVDEMNWGSGSMEGRSAIFTDDGCDLEPDSSLPEMATPREVYAGWLDWMELLE